MHKHFRIMAVSNYLSTWGYDPNVYTHLRIPGIWEKLSEFFNMPVIDDRENNMDAADNPNYEDSFKPFDLPWDEYGELIMQRAAAISSEAASSPPELDKSPAEKKRKRGEASGAHNAKTRSSTVEDSEAENEDPSPAPKSRRGTRSTKRGASKKAKADSPEPDDGEDEEEDEDGSEEEEQSEEEEEEEEEAPAAKSRGPGRGWRRGRARARGANRRR